jgi:hypothetical protein
MASFAMSFSCVNSPNTLAAHYVLYVGDGLHVGRIDAPAIAAQVVNYQSFGDWPNGPFISNAMCQFRIPLAEPKSPISGRAMNITEPLPASAFKWRDLAGKSRNISGRGHGQRLDDDFIAASKSAAIIVLFVVGVLAGNATPIQTVRSMGKSIKLRLSFLSLTAFTKLDRWARLWLSHVCSSSYDEWLWLEPLKRANVTTARTFYHSHNLSITQIKQSGLNYRANSPERERYYAIAKKALGVEGAI